MSETGTVLLVASDGEARGTVDETLSPLDVRVLSASDPRDGVARLADADVSLVVAVESALDDPASFREAVARQSPSTATLCVGEPRDSTVAVTGERPGSGGWDDWAVTGRVRAALTGQHSVPADVAVRAVREAFETGDVETREDVCARVVVTAADAFALPTTAVYLLDEDRGVLEPAARSAALGGESAPLPPLGSETPAAWHAFGRDRTVVLDATTGVGDAGLARFGPACILAPVGDSGLVVAGTARAGTVEESTTDAVELLTTTAALSLDRVRSDRERRHAERLLDRRTTELARVRHINDKVRKMDQALVRAETREAIERIVCERLMTSDRFAFAWIGGLDDGGTALDVRSMAGAERGYLDAVSLSLGDDTDDSEPALRTVRTGEVTTVSRVSDGLRDEPWREAALLRDFHSAASVPLVYGDVTYGVVTIYASRPAAFDDLAVSVLSEMGETIGYAIDAAERRAALLGDTVTELDVAVEAPDDAFVRLAQRLDARIDIESLSTRGDSKHIAYVTVHDAAVDDVVEVAAQSVSVEESSRVTERRADVVEVVIDGPCIPATFAELGAEPQSVTVAESQTYVTTLLPRRTGVRSFLDQLETLYPDVTIAAQRSLDRPMATSVDRVLGDELTDRQREVFEVAYFNGFFEWPRESTGEEVAAMLDISQPAFLQHLRACERKLANALCERDR